VAVSPPRTVQFRNLVNVRYLGEPRDGSLELFYNHFDFTAASGFVQIHSTKALSSQSATFDFPKAQKLEVYSLRLLGYIRAPDITELRIPIDLMDVTLLPSRTGLPAVTKLCLLPCRERHVIPFIAIRDLQDVMPNITSIELASSTILMKRTIVGMKKSIFGKRKIFWKTEDNDVQTLPISLSGIKRSQASALRIRTLSVTFDGYWNSQPMHMKKLLQAIQAHVEERKNLGCPALQTLCFNSNPSECDELDWLRRRVTNLEVREQDPPCPEFARWASEGRLG